MTRLGQSGARRVLWELWLPVTLVVVLWFTTSLDPSVYLPSLPTITERLVELWTPEKVMAEVVPSLLRLVAGFALAVLLGTGLGLVLGLLPAAEAALRPLTEAFRATPGVALLPIAMIFFGTGETMKITMIAFISTWPIMLNTIEGVRSVDPVLRSVMSSYRMKWADRFRFVILPAASPQILAGTRIALAVAIVVPRLGTILASC